MSAVAERASAGEVRFRGVPAVRLAAGATSVVLLPGLGLTGVSLRHRDGEYLALPGGLDALRAGRTSGLPLLAPWANRLSSSRYRVGRVEVDVAPEVAAGRVHVDGNGLPIHGLLAGRSVWTVDRLGVLGGVARLRARVEVDAAAFPFPHRLEVAIALREAGLTVDTTLVATGRRRVPVTFGWHPYLRVPGTSRNALRLRLPRRTHLLLDASSLPTGAEEPAAAESALVGRRTFDDLYRLGPRGRAMALEGADGRSVTVRLGAGYPFGQVWVPQGRPFASLEPMTAPTDALTTGAHPSAAPGESFAARFLLELA